LVDKLEPPTGNLLYGLDSQLDPIECPDEVSGGKKITGEFIVVGRDALPIHVEAEEVLDLVPPSEKALGTIGLLDSVERLP
jgi:hypothetical protein